MESHTGLIFKVIRSGAKHLRLSTSEKMVLVVLMEHWNPKRNGAEVWPGQPRIADHAGLSVRSVQYAIQNIERCGYIKTTQEPGRSTRYQILADAILAACTPATVAPTPANTAGVPLQPLRPTPADSAPTPATVAYERLKKSQKNALRLGVPESGQPVRAAEAIPERLMRDRQ